MPPIAPASQPATMVGIPPPAPEPCEYLEYGWSYCYSPVMESPFDTVEEAKSSCLCDPACEGVYDSAGVEGWSGKAYVCKNEAGRGLEWDSHKVEGFQGSVHWKLPKMFSPWECSEYWASSGKGSC
ncbi:unnamed protein product [Prorocentrum cordatum]|nr:unnamed protein product [Polarella glacialis]